MITEQEADAWNAAYDAEQDRLKANECAYCYAQVGAKVYEYEGGRCCSIACQRGYRAVVRAQHANPGLWELMRLNID